MTIAKTSLLCLGLVGVCINARSQTPATSVPANKSTDEAKVQPDNRQAFCTVPIDRSATKPVGARLTYTCDGKACRQRADVIDLAFKRIMAIESSACFRKFFTDQKKIDEMHGNTVDQIVDDLSRLPLKETLHFNSRLTVVAFGWTGCGGADDDDPNYIDTKKVCWNSYDSIGKASYLAHEMSHSMGYTHACTNPPGSENLRAGNEQTVPYLTEAAVEKCWDEQIIREKAAADPAANKRKSVADSLAFGHPPQ